MKIYDAECFTSAEARKISSHAVGLLAVIAVSGSVACLTLGKRKLWHCLFPSTSREAQALSMRPLEAPSRPCETESIPVMATSQIHKRCTSAPPGQKTPSLKKKVTFAPDVVEPAGNGKEYRWKVSCQRCGVSMQDNQSSIGVDVPTKGSRPSRMSTLAKPKLPANRLALYNGMRQYRTNMNILHNYV